jgi:hypothetical protein
MRGSFIVQLKQLSAVVAHVAQSRIEQLKKEIEEAEQLKKKAQAELDMRGLQRARLIPSSQRLAAPTSVLIAGSEEILALPSSPFLQAKATWTDSGASLVTQRLRSKFRPRAPGLPMAGALESIPVPQARHAFLLGAMHAAEDLAVMLDAVSDDAAAAMRAGRRERLNRTFERVEDHGSAIVTSKLLS